MYYFRNFCWNQKQNLNSIIRQMMASKRSYFHLKTGFLKSAKLISFKKIFNDVSVFKCSQKPIL